jgi:hypothetical protein
MASDLPVLVHHEESGRKQITYKNFATFVFRITCHHMRKTAHIRVRPFCLLLFCCPLLFFSCKKEAVKKTVRPACYDFMVADSNMTQAEAAYSQYYYFNSEHKLTKHVAYSGGVVAWSDSFAYDHGNMVKSWMALGSNNIANYYTRSEYDYTDTLITGSRYYLGSGTLIVHSVYGYDTKGELTSYSQYTDNTTLQPEHDYTYNLTYDDNGNVTQLTDGSGNVVALYLNYDNYPNATYKMPFDWAYDVLSYFNVFSKHNAGQTHSYSNPYVAHDTTGASYTYTYANSKVSTITSNSSDGTVLSKVNSLCK